MTMPGLWLRLRPRLALRALRAQGGRRTWHYSFLSAPFAFSQFDRPDKSGDTREQRMLAFSLADSKGPSTLAERVLSALDQYVWEPACVVLRFFELLAIFVPVLVAAPMAFVVGRGATAWYNFLTWAMEKAGPSFIKLGQWAASRTDIFPEGMCEAMGKLHSKAKKHSFRHTRRQIKADFGREIADIFEEFDPEPVGIGAMGQVYRASLHGQEVVVKVLHPDIEKKIHRDLKIISFFAACINALPTMEWLSLPGEAQTFSVMMISQLDLRIEAQNLSIFAENFADRPNIAFPKPYLEYTTRSVMVEELVQAVPMERILKYCSHGPLDSDIASLGLDAFLKMLLLDNFIHADLHPGNIMVRFHKGPLDTKEGQQENLEVVEALAAAPNQNEWLRIWNSLQSYQIQVVFIDAGLVTELRERERRNFIDLFLAIATFDGYRAGELMVERSRTPETAIHPDIFAMRTQQLVDKVKQRTFALGSVKLGDLLTSMLGMVRNHHVRMESDFITVVLSILLLEGIGRQLDPDLDIFKAAIPILREVGQHGDIALEASPSELLQMAKVWLLLEARQLVQASVKDVYRCVKYDLLSPNA